MERRKFIYASISSYLLMNFPLMSCSESNNSSSNELFYPTSLIGVLDSDGILAIGKLYLKENNHEANPDQLKNLIFGNKTPMEFSKLKEYLDNKINLDFTIGLIAIVDGWLLAQTEARLCALFYELEKLS